MTFKLSKTIEILSNTPSLLNDLLNNLSPEWTMNNEGENTWSPFDIVGHLIHGEKTDWIPRAKLILESEEIPTFEAFDRFAQFENSKGKTLQNLLDEFEKCRLKNLDILKNWQLSITDLQKQAYHPDPKIGTVNLEQLLAAWSVHDLSHIAQISRVMAKQYKVAVGTWQNYLPILQS